MRQATDSHLGVPLSALTRIEERVPRDDPHVRETLKRCSESTREAASEFRRTGNAEYVPLIVRGLIEHYVEPAARVKLSHCDDTIRLVEDLAIDSLTLLEIVFVAEEVFQVSIDNEDLRPFRTMGDVNRFVAEKLSGGTI